MIHRYKWNYGGSYDASGSPWKPLSLNVGVKWGDFPAQSDGNEIEKDPRRRYVYEGQ